MKIKRIYYAIFHPRITARAKRYWTHWRRHVAVMQSFDYHYSNILPEVFSLVRSDTARMSIIDVDGDQAQTVREYLRSIGYDLGTK